METALMPVESSYLISKASDALPEVFSHGHWIGRQFSVLSAHCSYLGLPGTHIQSACQLLSLLECGMGNDIS